MVPIIDELKKLGHEVHLTVRDFAQTAQLVSNYNLEYSIIENHGGKRLWCKGFNLAKGVFSMVKWVALKKFDLALSHNSYSQAIAASIFRIPMVTMMDYEFQPANHLSFRLATSVLVPDLLPDDLLRKFGANGKLNKYKGVKEQIYLSSFSPESDFLKTLGLNTEKIIAVLRPPATMAIYHRFDNVIFDHIFEHLADKSNLTIVLLPRTREQKRIFESKMYANVFIPKHAINGANLIYHSDLVISAGGTMNREAVVLGTPTYTVYAGQLGSIDSHFISTGRMIHIKSDEDISKIVLQKKRAEKQSILENKKLLHDIVEKILSVK
jgi:predicted glycosyltransferase